MSTIKRQYGMSALGWLFLLIVFGITFTVIAKLMPFYAENQYVVEALRSVGETPEGVESLSNREIEQKIYSFYTVNGVRSEGATNIEIERQANKVLVMINYEARVPMFYNVDAVMKFNNVLDSKFPGECCKPRAE